MTFRGSGLSDSHETHYPIGRAVMTIVSRFFVRRHTILGSLGLIHDVIVR
jgi:hypothetical protein